MAYKRLTRTCSSVGNTAYTVAAILVRVSMANATAVVMARYLVAAMAIATTSATGVSGGSWYPSRVLIV